MDVSELEVKFYGPGPVPEPWVTDCPVPFDVWSTYGTHNSSEHRLDLILNVHDEHGSLRVVEYVASRSSTDAQATAHVSGAAAIMLVRYPELIGRPERIKSILTQTATDLGPERWLQGHGLLDVLRAMQAT